MKRVRSGRFDSATPLSGAVRVTVLLLLASVTSCRGGTGEEHTGTIDSDLSGASASRDVDTPQANVVVELGNHSCTGTLITPKLVLTAAHCLRQPNNAGGCAGTGSYSSVNIGLSTPNSLRTLSPFQIPATLIQTCVDEQSDGDVARDVALIYLNPTEAFIERVAIHRPRFIRPGSGDDGNFNTVTGDSIGVAGWSYFGSDGKTITAENLLFRQAAFPAEMHLNFFSGIISYVWGSGPGLPTDDDLLHTTGGDSGGPLFTLVNDPGGAYRDVFGVNSGVKDGPCLEPFNIKPCTRWVDITADGPSSWIRSLALDKGVSFSSDPFAPRGHTAKWLAQHGKDPNDFWYGEVDYANGDLCDPGDYDCDHWSDEHDNCPYVANADQTDSNDDGWGDACQQASCRCACDSTNNGCGDPDGDGVCGHCDPSVDPHCAGTCATVRPGELVDNCPAVSNGDQLNCNLALELANHPKDLRGDACDPVPCPNSTAVATPGVTGETCEGDRTAGSLCWGRTVRNNIVSTTIGAAPLTSCAGNAFCPRGSLVVTPTDVVGRFCQQNKSSQLFALDCNQAPVQDTDAFAWASADVETFDRAKPWHAIQFKELPSRDAHFTWAFGSDSPTATWNYDGITGDYAHWLAAGIVTPDLALYPECSGTLADPPGKPPGTCLDGRLWMHAKTPVGNTENTVEEIVSHRPVFIPTAPLHGDNMAGSISSLRPDEAFVTFRRGTGGLVARDPRWWLWQEIPNPAWSEVQQRTTAVLANDPSDGRFYVVGSDGTGFDASTSLSTIVRNVLADPTIVIASAAEPTTHVGVIDRAVIGAVVTSDGRRAAAFSAAQLLSARGATIGGGASLASSQAALTNTPSVDLPPARSAPIAVFSRAAGGAFVLGGTDPLTQAPLGDLWFMRVGDSLGRVTLSAPLGRVHAATFAFGDDRLWVMDTLGAHDRIVRVDPRSGLVEVAATWPTHLHGVANVWLSVDRDGWPLLALSRRSTTAVWKLRVGSHHRTRARRVASVRGTLVLPVVVDALAYTFITASSDGTPVLRTLPHLGGGDEDTDDDDDGCRRLGDDF